MPQQVKKSLVLSIYFALTASSLLVFWQLRNFDFVNYDDNGYVYENPHVSNGLTQDGIVWAFKACNLGYWQPLTWLSLMLDCQLFGPSPGRIHLMNVLLHLANTLLLFTILKKMTGSLWPSAFVAAAFALHPMHVESVAWIAERKDVLSTFFLLLTLAAYTSYVKRPSVYRYVLSLVLFAVGLMAKPMLVTLPFLLLLLDYWPLNRLMPQTVAVSDRRRGKSVPAAYKNPTLYRIIIEKVPFVALSVISSIITFLTQQVGGSIGDFKACPLNIRVANAFLSYTKYIGKMFWSQNLAVSYPFNVESIPLGQAAICALLLFIISVFAVRLGRSQRYLPAGWFWFVGTLIPVIGLVQYTSSAYADRFTYIPYIGLFIMIAWGLPELLSKWPQRKFAVGISAVIALTACGICAHQQVSYWNNSVTLYSHALAVTQNNYIAYNNLGSAYARLGRWPEAVDDYQQAIKIKPDFAKAYYNLGYAYGELGRSTEAIEAFKQAILIKSDYAKAHLNLGIAYAALGRLPEAIEAFKQAIKIKPDFAEAHNNLGIAYGKLGRLPEAIETFKQAIKIKPDYTDAHYNLGYAYGKLGRLPEAIEAFKQAVKIKPDYTDAHYNLGYAYLAIGDKNSALAEYNILKSLNSELANNLLDQINK